MEKEETRDEDFEIVVDKGSPEDQMLQALKHKGIEAEITSINVRAGMPSGHQLAVVEGILTCVGIATAFTAWVILLPSGRVYLLSIQDAWDRDIPVIPYLYSLLLGKKDNSPDFRQTDV